jgi:hypothetical protein
MNMPPASSGTKYISLGTGFDIYTGYKEGGTQIKRRRWENGTRWRTVRNIVTKYSFTEKIGFWLQVRNVIARKKVPFPEDQYCIHFFSKKENISEPVNFSPEEGSSMFLRNLDIHVQDTTVSQSRRSRRLQCEGHLLRSMWRIKP